MPTCICGKVCKNASGITNHGKWCTPYKEDKLKGGDGLFKVIDITVQAVDTARKELREECLPLAMTTLKDALNGLPMKESRVRAAIKVIEMIGAHEPEAPPVDKIIVKFGEHDDNEFIEEEEDDNKPIEGIVDQKVG